MQFVTRADVRAAAEATLKAWLPWTLARVCEAAGHAADHVTPPPDGAYVELHDVDQMLAAQPVLPAIATVVPRGEFTQKNRQQNAVWELIVNTASRGRNHGETIETSDLLCAAVRTVLHQHQSLGGIASATVVLEESYRPIGPSARLILSGLVRAAVTTTYATPLDGAPAEPPSSVDEPEETGTVATVAQITTNPQEP